MQHILPREAAVGKCIAFTFAPARKHVALHVHDIQTYSVVGFDMVSGTLVYLRVKSDGTVYDDGNWNATDISIMNDTEVRLLLKKGLAEIEAKAAELLERSQALSARALSYRDSIPNILNSLRVLADA